MSKGWVGMGAFRLATIAACVVAAACGKDSQAPDPGPKASELRVRPPQVQLFQLDSVQVVPSVLDDKGVLISGVSVTFQSDDPSIVTVSNVGVITSVGPAGSTTVKVRGANLTQTVPVTVGLVATKLTLDPNPVALAQKATVALTARLLDKINKPIPNAPITYTSSDTLLVKVASDGVATSVGPAGQVTVTARSGDFFASTTIAVTQVPTTIQPLPAKLRLGRNRTQALGAQVLDAVGTRITGFTAFTFTSLAPALVTVSADGLVTSVGPLGTANVRIAATGTSLTVDVPVEVLAATSPVGAQPTNYPVQWLYAVAFAGDSLVASSLNNDAVVISAVTGQMRTSKLVNYALGVAYDPSRNTSYFAETSGKITQVEHSRGVTSEFVTLSGTEVLSLAVTADSKFLVVGGSGKVVTIDLTSKAVRTITASVYALHLSLHPDGRRVYASGSGSLLEVDLVNGTTRGIGNVGGNAQANAVTSDGKFLWVAIEYSNSVGLIDLTTGAITTIPTSCGAFGLALTRDDRYVYAACANGGVVVVLDTETKAEVRRFTGLGEVRRVAMSPDGSIAAVASSSGLYLFR